MKKKKPHKHKCVPRFHRYLGERDYSYPDNHVRHLPDAAEFKCVECGKLSISLVKTRFKKTFFGPEIKIGNFVTYKSR